MRPFDDLVLASEVGGFMAITNGEEYLPVEYEMYGHAKLTFFCSLEWPNTIDVAERHVLVRIGHASTSSTGSEMCGRQQILVGFSPKNRFGHTCSML